MGRNEAGRGRRRASIIEGRWLLTELRRRRLEAGYTKQRDAAQQLGWPTSKLSMIESRQRHLHDEDLERLLGLYRVPKSEWVDYLVAAEVARRSEWWDDDLRHSIEEQLQRYTGYEQAASQLWTFQTSIFHGLLQAPDYTAAFVRERPLERIGSALVAHLLQHRARRQQVLDHRTDPLELHMVVLENALHQKVGGPAVMRAQLDHLVNIAETKTNVTIQVIPADRHVTFHSHYGHFTVLQFPPDRGSGVVFLEHETSVSFLDTLGDLDRYTARFEHLCELALPPGESLQKIKTLSEEEKPT